jgi:hypothetical protein
VPVPGFLRLPVPLGVLARGTDPATEFDELGGRQYRLDLQAVLRQRATQEHLVGEWGH